MWSVLARGTRCTPQPHSVGRGPIAHAHDQPTISANPHPTTDALHSDSRSLCHSLLQPSKLANSSLPCLTHSRCARFLEHASQSSTHTAVSHFWNRVSIQDKSHSFISPRSPVSGKLGKPRVAEYQTARLLLRNNALRARAVYSCT
jgi:hypothetical protein